MLRYAKTLAQVKDNSEIKRKLWASCMFFRTPAGLHLLLFFLLLPLDRQDHIVSAKEPEMR